MTSNGRLCQNLKKPMQRQLSEAINIENSSSNELLNLKSEYFRNNRSVQKTEYLQILQSGTGEP